MTTKTPAQLADEAAEAVRAINHLTLHKGYAGADDVYSVAVDLTRLFGYLPQMIDQMHEGIDFLADAGRLEHDDPEEGEVEGTSLMLCLGGIAESVEAATRAVREAGDELSILSSELSHLRTLPEDDEEVQP